jgi:hypothetical protein
VIRLMPSTSTAGDRDAGVVRVWVSTLDDPRRSTSFTDTRIERDALELGRCTPHELPVWLANVADTLDVEWAPFEVSRSNLRGKKRDAVAQWLRRGRS